MCAQKKNELFFFLLFLRNTDNNAHTDPICFSIPKWNIPFLSQNDVQFIFIFRKYIFFYSSSENIFGKTRIFFLGQKYGLSWGFQVLWDVHTIQKYANFGYHMTTKNVLIIPTLKKYVNSWRTELWEVVTI